MGRILVDDRLPLVFDVDPRRSRSVQVYETLKAAIVSLQLLPRTAISENRLCNQFGISRTPVREAIIRLSQEGLIDVFPQYGSFVAPISLRKVKQGHFVRDSLEIAILRRAAPAWSPAWSERLGDVTERLERLCGSEDYVAFHREDERFHMTFAACAGMDEVWRVIQDAKTQLDRVRQLAVPVAGHMERILAEHAAIAAALDAGDPSVAVAALQFHLDTVYATISLLIQRHGEYFDDTSPPTPDDRSRGDRTVS